MRKFTVLVLIGATVAGAVPAASYAQPYSQGETQRVCSSRTTEGVVIGGGLGGLVGNMLAGRGNREAGTVIGAVVGGLGGAAIAKAVMSNCERAVARDAAIQTARTGQTTQRVVPDNNQRVVTASLAEEQSSESQACRTVEYALADDSSPPEQVEVCEVSPGDWRAMG